MRYAPLSIKSVFVPALLALLSVNSATVSASTIYTLNSGNAAIAGYTGPYATATVTLAGDTATITFDSLSNGGNEYLFGDGGSVAVNVNGAYTLGAITGTQLPGFTANTYSDGGAGNEDGWGSFNQTINTDDGYPSSSNQISFMITSATAGQWATDAAVLTGNSPDGFFAAAHIYVCAIPCSASAGALATGFAAGNNGPVVTPHDFPPGVPEPSTLLLLGTGLVAAARRFRRT